MCCIYLLQRLFIINDLAYLTYKKLIIMFVRKEKELVDLSVLSNRYRDRVAPLLGWMAMFYKPNRLRFSQVWI
jgi:hypothetical protein